MLHVSMEYTAAVKMRSFRDNRETTDDIRSSNTLQHARRVGTHVGDRAFPVASARVWNSLPSVRKAPSLTTFRRELKTVLFRSSFDNN